MAARLPFARVMQLVPWLRQQAHGIEQSWPA
jgi:hypothetical protein